MKDNGLDLEAEMLAQEANDLNEQNLSDEMVGLDAGDDLFLSELGNILLEDEEQLQEDYNERDIELIKLSCK